MNNFESHLCEVMWRSWVKGARISNFLLLLKDIFGLQGPPRLNAPKPVFDTWQQGEVSEHDNVHRFDSDV